MFLSANGRMCLKPVLRVLTVAVAGANLLKWLLNPKPLTLQCRALTAADALESRGLEGTLPLLISLVAEIPACVFFFSHSANGALAGLMGKK